MMNDAQNTPVICNCFRSRTEKHWLSEFEQGVLFAKTGTIRQCEDRVITFCAGTKEQEQCSCGGDCCKCDFYEHVRQQAIDTARHKLDELELAFYRDYIFDNGLLYDCVNKYEVWKKEHINKHEGES